MNGNDNIQMPGCPLKNGAPCDDNCAWFLVDEDDEDDFVCAITLIAQAMTGGPGNV
jgi:hypothetical protein